MRWHSGVPVVALAALLVAPAAATACTSLDIDETSETNAWRIPSDCTELDLAGRHLDDDSAVKLVDAKYFDKLEVIAR